MSMSGRTSGAVGTRALHDRVKEEGVRDFDRRRLDLPGRVHQYPADPRGAR
jgi:hypothetical protein